MDSTKLKGFNLIEQMTTLAVAALIMAAGTPLFNPNVTQNTIIASSKQTYSQLKLYQGAGGDQWISFLPSGRLFNNNTVSIVLCSNDNITGKTAVIKGVRRISRSTIDMGITGSACTTQNSVN